MKFLKLSTLFMGFLLTSTALSAIFTIIKQETEGQGTFEVTVSNTTDKEESFSIQASVSPAPVAQGEASLTISSGVFKVGAKKSVTVTMQKPLIGIYPDYKAKLNMPNVSDSYLTVTVDKLSDPDAKKYHQTKASYVQGTRFIAVSNLAFTF